MKQNKTPCDRGGADRYYGQPFNPHYVVDGVTVTDLTPEQIAEYRKGWNEEADLKNPRVNPYVEMSRKIFLGV